MQPPGFIVKGKEHLVCKLFKALYGLRQSPRAWYERIDSFLIQQGFTRGTCDSNLYRYCLGHDIVLLALYVDDILLTGSSSQLCSSIKSLLETNFEMSEMSDGSVTLYLKAELLQVSSGVFIIQRGYCKQVLETFGLLNSNPISTPMAERPRLMSNMQEDSIDPTLYRSMVGKLLHLTHTRPDITYAVSVVSRYMQTPQTSHLHAVKRIFRYLAGTWDSGILFRRGGEGITGYSDSDYAGDIESGRSTSGFVFCFGASPITWYSKKQPTVALSSTEAEYRALSEAAREAVWLRTLLGDYGLMSEEPILINCDNESSIRLARNPVFHSKTKHIIVHYHFAREKPDNGKINVTYIPTGRTTC